MRFARLPGDVRPAQDAWQELPEERREWLQVALDDFAQRGSLDNPEQFRALDERTVQIGRRESLVLVVIDETALVCSVYRHRGEGAQAATRVRANQIAAIDIGGHEWPNERPLLKTVVVRRR